MKYLLFSTIMFVSLSIHAKKTIETKQKSSTLVRTKTYLKDLDLPILKGSKIKVLNYNSQFKIYQIISVKHPAEGFSYTTLAFLRSSTKGLNSKAIKEDPLNLIDQELTLTQDLKTLHVPNDFDPKSFSSKK